MVVLMFLPLYPGGQGSSGGGVSSSSAVPSPMMRDIVSPLSALELPSHHAFPVSNLCLTFAKHTSRILDLLVRRHPLSTVPKPNSGGKGPVAEKAHRLFGPSQYL